MDKEKLKFKMNEITWMAFHDLPSNIRITDLSEWHLHHSFNRNIKKHHNISVKS